MTVDQKHPLRPGKDGDFAFDPRAIYLAPRCCYADGEGRLWCEDKVWPCSDCPDPSKARVAKYVLMEQIDGPQPDHLPEND